MLPAVQTTNGFTKGANGLAEALTLWEFRTSQIPRVHGNVSSARRVEADFITLDDNARRLGLHSVTYGFELRANASWNSQVLGVRIKQEGNLQRIDRKYGIHIQYPNIRHFNHTCTEHTLKTSGMSLLNSSKQPHAPDDANPVK